MDFDVLNASPEFASVMADPMSLISKIEDADQLGGNSTPLSNKGKLGLLSDTTSESQVREALKTVGPTQDPVVSLQVESQSSQPSDELFLISDPLDPPGKEVRPGEVDYNPKTSSISDSAITEVLAGGLVVKLAQPSPRPPTDGSTTSDEGQLTSAVTGVSHKKSSPNAHKRVFSGQPIPLKLSDTKDNKVQQTCRLSKDSQTKRDKGKGKTTQVDFASWAAGVEASSIKQHSKEESDTEHNIVLSDDDSFQSAPSHEKTPSDDETHTDNAKHTYTDLVSAISSLKGHLQRLEDRLIRHERECATDMAQISHKAGASWSGSNKGPVSKSVAFEAQPVTDVQPALTLAQPSQATGSSVVSQETVRSIISNMMRDYDDLPPRVAGVRLKEMIFNLTRASDVSCYSALPHTLDQAVEVVKSVSLGAALKRVS
jgi:hypothetical protein